MEETKIYDGDSGFDQFFDALDCFLPLDLIDTSESEESVLISQISLLDSFESKRDDSSGTNPASESSPSSILRHRPSTKSRRPKVPSSCPNDSSFENGEISAAVDRRIRILSDLTEEQDKVRERSESPSFASSSDRIFPKTDRNREQIEESAIADSQLEHLDGYLSNSLVMVAGLVIKVIGFQIGLLISSITFPFWLMHSSYMLVTSPFETVKRARDLFHEKFSGTCSALLATVSPSMQQQLHGSHSIRKFVTRIIWGCLWSIYVCFLLSGVLVSAFIMGGIAMRYLVEEPIQMENVLNFDYTKANPDAFVPIVSCHGVDCGFLGRGEKVEVGKRVIPPNRQLEVTVSLLLPESDHNRKLGVFQVYCSIARFMVRVIVNDLLITMYDQVFEIWISTKKKN